LICRAPGVSLPQQGLQPRAKPSDCAGLPLFLPYERLKIKLAMPRLLRLSRALFRRKALLLFPSSLSLLFLLWCRKWGGRGNE
jgi:hypothetical protein